jgi:hypothetical protein
VFRPLLTPHLKNIHIIGPESLCAPACM